MLVLTRKPNQQLLIGNDIVITVVKVRGNTIRLGIEAPKDVRIVRSELEFKIDKAQLTDGSPLTDVLVATVTDKANGDAAPADEPPAASDNDARAKLASIARSKLQARASGSLPVVSSLRAPRSSGRPVSKASASNGHPHDPAAGRNLEDSPLCHRTSLSHRAGLKLASHA